MSSLVEAKSLEKEYQTPEGEVVPVLKVDTFSLEPGQEMALRGGSGTGKTTFLNLIAGLVLPTHGQVTVDGVAVPDLPESARDLFRAQNIGYIFQSFHLLDGFTALENVELAMGFAGKVDSGRARDLLTRVGLEERLDYRPPQMSVGQRQRVAVARAVANRPKLVLADEPTGNLDPSNSHQVLDLIREVCRECQAALLLVSHDDAVLKSFEHLTDFTQLNTCLDQSSVNAF